MAEMIRFGDFASFKYGKMPNKKKVTEKGTYPVYSGYRYVGYYDEYNTEANQLIIVARGVGGTGDVKITKERCYLTNLSIAADIDMNVAIPEYLYYYFLPRNLRYLDSGSAQSQITISDLERVTIPLPPLAEQKVICSYLKMLDDKIVNNENVNENLQEQAQALYANMFIHNASDQWAEGVLSDVADIAMGQSPKGDTYNEDGVGTVFFQGRGEFGFRFPTRRLFTTDPKRMAQSNDVLMSVRAPVGDLNVAYEPCCIGRGLGAIRSKDNHQSFVLYTVFSLREKLDMFNGEGTVFGSINRDALNSMPIIIPTKDELERFEEIVAPMDAAIRNNYEEICRLEAIRDSLLPRLMSGEIDVSNIQL